MWSCGITHRRFYVIQEDEYCINIITLSVKGYCKNISSVSLNKQTTKHVLNISASHSPKLMQIQQRWSAEITVKSLFSFITITGRNRSQIRKINVLKHVSPLFPRLSCSCWTCWMDRNLPGTWWVPVLIVPPQSFTVLTFRTFISRYSLMLKV